MQMLENTRSKQSAEEKYWIFFALNLIFQIYIFEKPELTFFFFVAWVLHIWLFDLKIINVACICLIVWALLFVIYWLDLKDWNLFAEVKKIFNLHEVVVGFVKSRHDGKVAEFINLFLFNKDKGGNQIYKDFQQFGVVHLIVISGFHIVVLKRVLLKVFKLCFLPEKFSRFLINICLFLYWWSIDFAISGFRPVIGALLIDKNPINNWSKCFVLAFAANFQVFFNYSFILSFGISFLFLLIDKLDKDAIFAGIYKNIAAFVFSHLVLMFITKKIFFLSFMNLFIFAPIIMFLFFYYLFFSWFSIFSALNLSFMNCLDWLINNISINKTFISVDWINQSICCYLICMMTVAIILFSGFYTRKKYVLNLDFEINGSDVLNN